MIIVAVADNDHMVGLNCGLKQMLCLPVVTLVIRQFLR